MKVHKEMFDRWNKFVQLFMHEQHVNPADVNTPRAAWYIANQLDIPKEAYHVGLNDEHIETALRRIFPQAWPTKLRSDSGLEGPMYFKSIKIPLEEAHKLVGDISSWDDIEERNMDYLAEAQDYGRREALEEGKSEADAEEAGYETEGKAIDALFYAYRRALEATLEYLMEKIGLGVGFDEKTSTFFLTPEVSWKDSGELIMNVIEGEGMFGYDRGYEEFLSSGPYTPREAVRHHLHYARVYPDVYGGTSGKRYFENEFEHYTRSL